jgi:hypothetical protein
MLAILMAVVSGVIVLADVITSHWAGATTGLRQLVGELGYLLVSWTAIIAAFALFLGFFNIISVHSYRIRLQESGAIYSGVLLVSLFVTLFIGFVGGLGSPGSQFIFDYVLQPLEATIFSLLALFIATAAFRAFRVRSMETFFFVLFAVIVLLGQVPLGIYLWSEFPVIKDWILNVPTLAGVRGILLGVALGTIATGLRVLLGTERPYTD